MHKKIHLLPHQEEVLKKTRSFDHVAYYLDMGLGKTFVGSEKMDQLNTKVNLIICQKSKVKDWIQHMTDHYFMNVYDLRKPKELSEFIGEAMGEKNRICGVVNYETAWRRKQLFWLHNYTLMLDESSLIQNQTAKQTKFISGLYPQNVILLSGTPVSGKYENLISQIHLLGWTIKEDVFNRTYINFKTIDVNGFIHKIVDRDDPYKNVERLKTKLREHGAVFMKTEEVIDLPDQTFQTINVPVTKEYKKFMKDRWIIIDTLNLREFKDDSDFNGKDVTPRVELVGDTVLTKRLYARQLCGAYNKEKLDAVQDLIQSTNDRIIIFYNYDIELEALKRICKNLDRPVSEINGHVKDMEAYETESDSVTLVQYQAGAMGLNLQKSNKIIYFTLTDKSDLFEQSKKRIHRIGQDRPCYYYTIICEGSVEEAVHRTLLERKDYTDELFAEEFE